jgi:hypothetical protein
MSARATQLRRRLEKIRREIAELDLICPGTVVHKTKRCGKPTCRCATHDDARHGPYYEWHRTEQGRQRHSMLPRKSGPAFADAASSAKKLRSLVKQWEEISLQVLADESQINLDK